MAFPADVLSTTSFKIWRERFNSFKNAAFENLVAADDVLLGNISGASQPVAEITVAQIKTMLSLGSLSEKTYWSGTQAAYDALGSWDANTIYFVTN